VSEITVSSLINRVTDTHVLLYRITGGHIGHRLPRIPPMLLLDHTGAKSGTQRTTPVAYMSDGDRYVIVASKGGGPRHRPGFTTCAPTPTPASKLDRAGSQ
jgi:hypothetical protein